jgi:hypothetical protein
VDESLIEADIAPAAGCIPASIHTPRLARGACQFRVDAALRLIQVFPGRTSFPDINRRIPSGEP